MVEQFRMENNSATGTGYTGDDEKEKGEVVLASGDTADRKWFNWGKPGHIAKNCPLKKSKGDKNKKNKNKKFSGKCNHCGKRGHKRDNC